MTLNSAQRAIILHRRRQVALLRLRGLTAREVQQALLVQNILNPETGEPWALGTIHGDIKALEQEWRAEALTDMAVHKGQVLAELQEVRRVAWQTQDTDKVLRALTQVRALLGLDQPAKVAPTTPEGDREYQPVPHLSDQQRLERLLELVERSRAGRDRPDSDDGGL